MIKHPYFDLQLMKTDEIASVLNKKIVIRETLAQWPLSCVEKITATDGSYWIIKSNHKPCDIEGKFYTRVHHSSVIKPKCIQSDSPYQTIIYPYIEGDPYTEFHSTEKKTPESLFRTVFQPLLASINQPELPVYLKIDTQKDFLNTFRTMLARLTQLVEAVKFTQIGIDELTNLAEIIESPILLKIALQDTGLVHGDFSNDNILQINADEFIILDWQRPIYGSSLIDEYTFVRSCGENPASQAVLLGSLIQIYWLVDCSVNWFPEGINTYDKQIKKLLADLIAAYQELRTNQISM